MQRGWFRGESCCHPNSLPTSTFCLHRFNLVSKLEQLVSCLVAPAKCRLVQQDSPLIYNKGVFVTKCKAFASN